MATVLFQIYLIYILFDLGFSQNGNKKKYPFENKINNK